MKIISSVDSWSIDEIFCRLASQTYASDGMCSLAGERYINQGMSHYLIACHAHDEYGKEMFSCCELVAHRGVWQYLRDTATRSVVR